MGHLGNEVETSRKRVKKCECIGPFANSLKVALVGNKAETRRKRVKFDDVLGRLRFLAAAPSLY